MSDEFSDAFKSIVPESPSSDGWADGALRKRRNRMRLLAGVAGGAAIAMIVPLALALGGNNALIATPDHTESPSPQVMTPVPVPGPNALGAAPCWDEQGKARQVSAAGARDGAVRAWLCGDPDTVPQTVGPMEPLIKDVDVIVSFIQEQAVTSVNDGCDADAGPAYRIVLDYADGSQSVLSGETAGCRTIGDGQSIRAGGVELHDLALQLWRTQRDAFTPPNNVINLVNCLPESVREKRPMLPFDPARAVRGFLCTGVVTEDGKHGAAGSLDDALVRLITDSIRVDSSEKSAADLRQSWLTLTGGWGEQLTLQRTSTDMFQWFDGDTPMAWMPSAGLLSQLDAAVESPGATPASSPSPDGPDEGGMSHHNGCDGVTRDDVGATALEGGVLPDSPETVWLCGQDAASQDVYGLAGPLEPLAMMDLMATAVEAFNALEPAQPGLQCPADAGPSYLVVFDYPDGAERVVQLDLAGCRGATAGDQTRQGGDEYIDSLLELWEEQRRLVPPAQKRSGAICPEFSSVFDLDPSVVEIVSGSACVGWQKGVVGNSVPGREVPLSAELVAELSAQLNPTSVEVDFERISDDSIVLLTRAGDPLTLLRMDDGRLLVWGVTPSGLWTPTGDLAQELDRIFGS